MVGTFKKYGLFGAAWAGLGSVALLTHYLVISPYNKTQLDEKLTLLVASHFNLSQLVDNLPAVFRENPHAAALKLSDLRGTFLGAMYDSRRMSGAEYQKFIGGNSAPTVAGLEVHAWESKRRKLKIYALSLPRMQFTEYLSLMGRDYALHYAIPLFLLLGALCLVGWHFFSTRKIWSVRPMTGAARPIAHNPATTPPKPMINSWRIKTGTLAESGIKTALEKILKATGATRVALYARSLAGKSGMAWQGVLEMRGVGSFAVRGEGVAADELLATEVDENIEHLASVDHKSWIFFSGPAGQAHLAFALSGEAIFSKTTFEISELVKSMSRGILVEHRYENSILDSESGLYSTPYATFTLKEKIIAGLPFALAAFRPKHNAPMDKLSRAAIRILREAFSSDDAPIIARAETQTILIVFQAGTASAEKAGESFERLFSAYRSMGIDCAAALIADASGTGSAQHAFALLEKRLALSESSGRPETYRQSGKHHLHVVPNPADTVSTLRTPLKVA